MSDEIRFASLLTDFFGREGTLALVLLGAAASFALARLVLAPAINQALERNKTDWDDALAVRGVFNWLAFLVPALILYFFLAPALVPYFDTAYHPTITALARRIILVYIAINVVIIVNRLLSAGLDIYRLYPISEKRPIKGYIQLAKLVLYIVGAIVTVSVLLDKSPLGILGGIGALTAILVLVFRDTILSLIASIQFVADDLVRRGDWIEMPDFGADGEVIDIALHTVKVQNWDKTIITIPTYRLIDGSFQNWRGMSEAGGRRIKRSLLIDQASVRFCDDALMERFRRIRRLEPYLEAKRKELDRANAGVGDDDGLALNHRVLTNLGTFRAYVIAYLEENARLRQDMTFMVRQLPPSPDGLPLEVYVFTNDTKWVNYEGIQADIFDHLLAAVSYFDLRIFQHPTGHDLHSLQQRSKAADPPDGVLP